MTDYTELKRLAEEVNNSFPSKEDVWSMVCTPTVALELIADLERHQRMLVSACMSMGAIGESLGVDMDSDGDEMLGMVAELKAERDQFKAENERLAAENNDIESAAITYIEDMQQSQHENERLKAEVDSLTREADRQYTTIEAYRKDAERYRWLRENAQQDVDGWRNEIPILVHAMSHIPEWKSRIDQSIDATMSKGEQS